MRIIFVDDDPVMRALTRRILQRLGHEPEVFPDAEQAWSAILQRPPRVVISDWIMPQLDGLGLCERIRSRKNVPYTYFILVSAGIEDPGNFDEIFQRGVDDLLTKPLVPQQVWARLHVAERMLNINQQLGAMGKLIPICSYCKKIRNDEDYWDQVETYIQQQTGGTFSHGICPECFERVINEENLALGENLKLQDD